MAFGDHAPKPKQDFPPPNFINPETRVPLVLGLTISTCVLVLFMTSARLWSRVYKAAFGSDDWMMLAASVFAVTLTGLGASNCLYGLGYHIWDRKSEWTEPYYKLGYAFSVVYPITVGLTKMSICQTYLRIFPYTTSRLFSHTMTAFVLAYTLTCIILMLVQCHPIEANWLKDVPITCVNMHANMLSVGAINTLTDFIVYLWPARYLWRIQLPLKQRLGLIFVFTCGLVVCVAGVLRLVYLNRYFTNFDLYWDAALTITLSIVESNIGIVCGCLPCIKPVLAKVFPSLFGSTGASKVTEAPSKGGSYRIGELPGVHKDKAGSMSELREDLDDVLDESDEASTHSSQNPVLYKGRGKVERVRRDPSTLPQRGIWVDQTVSVERSDDV